MSILLPPVGLIFRCPHTSLLYVDFTIRHYPEDFPHRISLSRIQRSHRSYQNGGSAEAAAGRRSSLSYSPLHTSRFWPSASAGLQDGCQGVSALISSQHQYWSILRCSYRCRCWSSPHCCRTLRGRWCPPPWTPAPQSGRFHSEHFSPGRQRSGGSWCENWNRNHKSDQRAVPQHLLLLQRVTSLPTRQGSSGQLWGPSRMRSDCPRSGKPSPWSRCAKIWQRPTGGIPQWQLIHPRSSWAFSCCVGHMCLQLGGETRISILQGKRTTVGCDEFRKGGEVTWFWISWCRCRWRRSWN